MHWEPVSEQPKFYSSISRRQTLNEQHLSAFWYHPDIQSPKNGSFTSPNQCRHLSSQIARWSLPGSVAEAGVPGFLGGNLLSEEFMTEKKRSSILSV